MKWYINEGRTQARILGIAYIGVVILAGKKNNNEKAQEQSCCITLPTLYKGCKMTPCNYRLSQWFQLSSL